MQINIKILIDTIQSVCNSTQLVFSIQLVFVYLYTYIANTYVKAAVQMAELASEVTSSRHSQGIPAPLLPTLETENTSSCHFFKT